MRNLICFLVDTCLDMWKWTSRDDTWCIGNERNINMFMEDEEQVRKTILKSHYKTWLIPPLLLTNETMCELYGH